MRVVLLIRSLGCGGAERQLVRLAKGLAQHHTVSILAFYPIDNFFKAEIEAAALEVISLRKRSRWDLVAFTLRFLAAIRSLQPDVIYAFMNTAGMLSLAAGVVRPATRIVWGIRSSNMDLRRYGILPGVLRRIEATLSSLAHLVISNSEAGKAEALKDGFSGPIVVIPNGIDTTRFAFSSEARHELRGAWGVDSETRVIGIVARQDPMKGYETFLRAAALHAATNPQTRFLIVGDGHSEYHASLVRLATDLRIADRIIWAGRADDVAPFYSAMDLCTSSSVFGEGFSNAIGEAMACGLECVVTDTGDARQIVGPTGLVVPPRSPDALAAGWAAALAKPPRTSRNGESDARSRIVAEYGEQRMVSLTESALLSTLIATEERTA